METFVEIINAAEVRSNLDLEIEGIQANMDTWKHYSFYPNSGVVGVVITEAQCYEGTLLIIQCGKELIVPVFPSGLRQISYSEFSSRYPRNMETGRANDKQMKSAFNVDEFMDSFDKMFGL